MPLGAGGGQHTRRAPLRPCACAPVRLRACPPSRLCAFAPARLVPAISVSDQDIPSRCQIGGSAARDCGICSVSLSYAITPAYAHLTCPGQRSLFPNGPTWRPLTLLVG